MSGMALSISRAVTYVAALFLWFGRYGEYEQYEIHPESRQ